MTAAILQNSTPQTFQANRDRVVGLCEQFIRMYRPHESREDTVLFPALRTILTPKEVLNLGDHMEESEHKVLGDEGFEKSVDQVAAIEKQLGISRPEAVHASRVIGAATVWLRSARCAV